MSFRDEEPVLPYLLASLESLVDGIVAMDDGSTDDGAARLRSSGAIVVPAPPGTTFGQRRQLLLEEGRRRRGTHFVVVDADEAFTATLSRKGRHLIEALAPGDAMGLPFYTLWKGAQRYRAGREYDLPIWTVFADDGVSAHPDARIHEARIPPGLAGGRRVLPAAQGGMVHLQFVSWDRAQVKQAWYRCKERLDGASPLRVNARYLLTLDGPLVRSRPIDPAWVSHLPSLETLESRDAGWQLDQLLNWFDRYTPAYFEPLQIWHVPVLRQAFEAAEGRPPRPARFTPHLARFAGDVYGSTRAVARRIVRWLR
ncbi:MAG: hypothetical protein ACRD12_06035 [Acidimicrobiales bacterium]